VNFVELTSKNGENEQENKQEKIENTKQENKQQEQEMENKENTQLEIRQQNAAETIKENHESQQIETVNEEHDNKQSSKNLRVENAEQCEPDMNDSSYGETFIGKHSISSTGLNVSSIESLSSSAY